MRKKEAEVNDRPQIEGILKQARVLHLAMCKDGRPYVIPITFAYAQGSLYIHTGPKGLKMDYLAANPRVAFNVVNDVEFAPNEEPCRWGCRYSSAAGTGKAVILEDEAQRIEALNILMRKYAGREYEFPETTMRRTVVIRIDIDQMTGRLEA